MYMKQMSELGALRHVYETNELRALRHVHETNE